MVRFALILLLLSIPKLVVAENVHDMAQAIEEMPAWRYNPVGERDPFQIPPELLASVEGSGHATEASKPRRIKEFLESFQLDSLKLVATVYQVDGQPPVAMVEDPAGVGHVVRPGQYLGANEGRIMQIMDGAIIIEEQVPDKKAKIPTRSVTLKLPREVDP
ncbi:MAG: pilus assembly protein PilP [Magnetococcus sp. THC-1_WYH]